MDQDNLRSLARAEQRLAVRHDTAHEALVRAVWEAIDGGTPQVEVARATGKTRERIRQICGEEYRDRALKRWAARRQAGN